MKELTIEEKAKAYDEALGRAKKVHKYSSDIAEIKRIEDIFPELKESEDEKIRKAIKNVIDNGFVSREDCHYFFDDYSKEQMIAWLEKQGEQKSTKVESCTDNLNTEFQKQVANLLASVLNREHEYTQGFVEWASQSLLGYAKNELGKQEWSEEDEVMLDEIIDFFENGTVKLQHNLSLYASWLKSLRPQNHWKPSEEQMDALDYYANSLCTYCDRQDDLRSLFNVLKKL